MYSMQGKSYKIVPITNSINLILIYYAVETESNSVYYEVGTESNSVYYEVGTESLKEVFLLYNEDYNLQYLQYARKKLQKLFR
jgi:hypothetical protein